MMNTTYKNTEYALKYSVTYVAYVNTISEYLWTPLDTFWNLISIMCSKLLKFSQILVEKCSEMLFSFDP